MIAGFQRVIGWRRGLAEREKQGFRAEPGAVKYERWAESALELLGRTWRFEVLGAERLAALRREKQPRICVLWHRDLIPLVWLHRDYPTAILVSRSSDGRLLREAARGWAYRIVEGSSTNGGSGALKALIEVLRCGGEIGLAPDGPKGPPFRVKPGVVLAAQRTGAPIVAIAAYPSSAWRVPSWDRMIVPRPFARIRVAYSEPLYLPPGLDPRRLGTRLVESALREAELLARP